jgi:hypothetical protein
MSAAYHGDRPLIELRGVEDATPQWRPGSEILDRQVRTMAILGSKLRLPS